MKPLPKQCALRNVQFIFFVLTLPICFKNSPQTCFRSFMLRTTFRHRLPFESRMHHFLYISTAAVHKKHGISYKEFSALEGIAAQENLMQNSNYCYEIAV